MGKTSKDKRDIYYRHAKSEGYRARSAFKLIQIDEKFDILEGVTRAVDLCAAPGSWSQVLSNRLYFNEEKKDEVKIVAVDLQDMSPIPGVHQLKGDITKLSTAQEIISYFNDEKAQVVVCDGAPDVTGLHEMDEYVQGQLLLAALCITTHVLTEGGTFVAKIFRASECEFLCAQLRIFFKKVAISKPASSRNSSIEAFVVCQDYRPPDGYIPQMIDPMCSDIEKVAKETGSSVNAQIVPFIVCGDLRGFDSDMSYSLMDANDGKEYEFKEVVQKPISPAYKEILEKTKNISLKHQNFLVKEVPSHIVQDEASDLATKEVNILNEESNPQTSTSEPKPPLTEDDWRKAEQFLRSKETQTFLDQLNQLPG